MRMQIRAENGKKDKKKKGLTLRGKNPVPREEKTATKIITGRTKLKPDTLFFIRSSQAKTEVGKIDLFLPLKLTAHIISLASFLQPNQICTHKARKESSSSHSSIQFSYSVRASERRLSRNRYDNGNRTTSEIFSQKHLKFL